MKSCRNEFRDEKKIAENSFICKKKEERTQNDQLCVNWRTEICLFIPFIELFNEKNSFDDTLQEEKQ